MCIRGYRTYTGLLAAVHSAGALRQERVKLSTASEVYAESVNSCDSYTSALSRTTLQFVRCVLLLGIGAVMCLCI